MPAPLPRHEAERLTALQEYHILDTQPEEAFDTITRLASLFCETPIALISLVDESRQWFKSRVGLEATETHRDHSFCAHAILQTDTLVVPDALEDERFAQNPLVTGEPNIRFYAGIPLLSSEGYPLGSLCVIDNKPRNLSTMQLEMLKVLGREAAAQLEIHRLSDLQEESLRDYIRVVSALAESEERFRIAIDVMQEGFVLYNAKEEVVVCNQRAEQILGLTQDQIANPSLVDPGWSVIHEDGTKWEDDDYPISVARSQGKAQHNVVMGVVHPNGNTTWISVNASPLSSSEQSKPNGVLVTFADITDRRRMEEQVQQHFLAVNEARVEIEIQAMELLQVNQQLEVMAITDGLTGLNNHRSFQERLAEEFMGAKRSGAPLSGLLLDVDKFKEFNDNFGHPAGDEVLKQVASTLKRAARGTDFVARYGGEEFVAVLPQTDKEGAIVVAERIRTAVEALPIEYRQITISLGVSTLRAGSRSTAELVNEADKALYRSKKGGRNRVSHFHEVGK